MKQIILILILVIEVSCGNKVQNKQHDKTVSSDSSTLNTVCKVNTDTYTISKPELKDTFDIVYRNSERDYYENPESCYDNMIVDITEAEYLAAFSKYENIYTDTTTQIRDNNGIFSIPLNDSTFKEIKNEEEMTDAMIRYESVGYIPDLDYYKFIYWGFEWNGIMLISKKNGKEYRFNDDPLFSPNGEVFVTVCLEQEGVDQTGLIEAYRVMNNEFEFLFGLWSKSIMPNSACWYNNNTLFLKINTAEKENDFKYYKIVLSEINKL